MAAGRSDAEPHKSCDAEGTQGDWNLIPQPSGAFGPTAGTPGSTVTLSLSATTQAFDPNAGSPSGDLWLTGVNPNAAFAPVLAHLGERRRRKVS